MKALTTIFVTRFAQVAAVVEVDKCVPSLAPESVRYSLRHLVTVYVHLCLLGGPTYWRVSCTTHASGFHPLFAAFSCQEPVADFLSRPLGRTDVEAARGRRRLRRS